MTLIFIIEFVYMYMYMYVYMYIVVKPFCMCIGNIPLVINLHVATKPEGIFVHDQEPRGFVFA